MNNDCIVNVHDGQIRGKKSIDYNGNIFYSFQGIPYAKPPIGNLRFKAPLPPEPWQEVLDATKEGNCSLSKNAQLKIIGSENCLFLNVYTPQIRKTSGKSNLKPIMFWVHGGAFISGSGGTDLFGPEYLLTQDIILVTINYRLGVLGFLSLEDSSLGVPGNAALKDIVLSLKWVQKNIETFFGNPKKVTIAGSSAGAALVHFLMLSPMTKGLFHGAILQSGCALNCWAVTKSNPKEIAKELGCKSKNEKDILHFLQSVSAEELIQAQFKLRELHFIHKIRSVGPVIESDLNNDAFITEHPIDIIKSGNYNKVPVIIGYTSEEAIICELIYESSCETFRKLSDFQTQIPFFFNIPSNTDFSKRTANKIRNYYYNGLQKNEDNLSNYYTLKKDLLIMMGTYNTIKYSIVNLQHPIYFYRFSAVTSLNVMKKLIGATVKGACHGDDHGHLFKSKFNPEIKKDSIEEKCMLRIIKLWSNFVKYGNPNDKLKNALLNITWQPVKPDKFYYLDIGTELRTGLNLEMERMEIWNEISTTNPFKSKF